jgi:hypothetical protein
MKIELMTSKNIRGHIMKKRNKRTEIMAHEDLSPLTEEILARMGQEGANIVNDSRPFIAAALWKTTVCWLNSRIRPSDPQRWWDRPGFSL